MENLCVKHECVARQNPLNRAESHCSTQPPRFRLGISRHLEVLGVRGCSLFNSWIRASQFTLPSVYYYLVEARERKLILSISRSQICSRFIAYDFVGFICSVGLISQSFSSDIMFYVSYSYLLRFGPYIEMLYSRKKNLVLPACWLAGMPACSNAGTMECC